MSLARILVPIRGDGQGERVLAHALALGRRVGAHIRAVHCRARPEDMIPYGVVVPGALRAQIKAQAAGLADEEEAHLKGLFQEMMGGAGVEVIGLEATPPRDRVSASWLEAEGKQVDVVRRLGRLADVTAVAKPDRDRNLGLNTLRAAIFGTGRPVLLCPGAAPESLGARVAIAWNGSLEVSRTMALALPLVDRASEVTVLDGAPEGAAADGAALLRYLADRGVTAERRPIAGGDHPGRALLAAAEAAGADLLVMGAYGHSQELEAVLGGATQEVVDRATLPILFAH